MKFEFLNGFTRESPFHPISIGFSISKFVVFCFEYYDDTMLIGFMNFAIQIDF